MINLVMGRSGRGKDRFVDKLIEFGLKAVNSYSTRNPRFPGENTHIFIPPEDCDKYPNKIATTTINGNFYFATKEQVDESDIYIIDPAGIKELTENMPDEDFHIIHIVADKEEARKHAIQRVEPDKQDAEAAIFDAREADEDAQFSAFEALIDEYTSGNYDVLPENIRVITEITNDYTDAFFNHAINVYKNYRTSQALAYMIKLAIKHNIMQAGEKENTVILDAMDEHSEKHDAAISIEYFADILSQDGSQQLKPFIKQLLSKWNESPDFFTL